MKLTAPHAAIRLRSVDRARDAWPLDPETIHLNHGSFGAVPTHVLEHQNSFHRLADRNPVDWFPRLGAYVREAVTATAPFLGVSGEDSAFVPNASAAATVVFNSLRLVPGDNILVTDHGYGAITMGAERLARRFGAEIRTVEIPLLSDTDEIIERFTKALTEHTRLIVVDQITSATARIFPTAQIAALAAERGIRTLVDGAHAAGLIPDAAAVGGGDWWFGNMHKWPCAPRGAAVLTTRAQDRDELWPLIDSWGAPEPFPYRFDTQGTTDVTAYLATPAAIRFIEEEYGWQKTRHTLSELADLGAEIISESLRPFSTEEPLVSSPTRPPSMRLIRLPAGLGQTREEADDLRTQMFAETGVETAFTSFRGVGYFRLSAHLYTEIDDFVAFTERCVPALARRTGVQTNKTSVIS